LSTYLKNRTQKIPEPLSVAAIEMLLQPPGSEKFTLVRTQAAIECAYDLGLRASELVHLKLEDLNLVEGWLRIRRGKGGCGRVLPLGPKVIDRLRRYLEVRAKRFPVASDDLFLSAKGRPISRTTFWWLLKERARRVGLRGRVAPHQLRHSFCSHMLAGGASLKGIQNLAGHRRLSSTERYLHLDLDFLRESMKSHPRFGK
jgi:integrase/recombinase XerD